MFKTWLYDDDSAILSVLNPDSHVLQHVPRPAKKDDRVGCPINKSLQSKNQHTKHMSSLSSV